MPMPHWGIVHTHTALILVTCPAFLKVLGGCSFQWKVTMIDTSTKLIIYNMYTEPGLLRAVGFSHTRHTNNVLKVHYVNKRRWHENVFTTFTHSCWRGLQGVHACYVRKALQHAQRQKDSHWSSSTVSFLQLRQKLVTCSLSSRDPITALNSLGVTMLAHN